MVRPAEAQNIFSSLKYQNSKIGSKDMFKNVSMCVYRGGHQGEGAGVFLRLPSATQPSLKPAKSKASAATSAWDMLSVYG